MESKAHDFIELLHTRRSEWYWDHLAELIRLYFRIEVDGIENIPRKGPVLIAPNHSGYAGADTIMLSHIIHRRTGRIPRIIAHRAFFEWSRLVRLLSHSFGLCEASYQSGVSQLKADELVMIFPEAETGNFKASTQRYKLQRFHTGYLRMALATGAPIVPCLVMGAEESHLNLGALDLSRFIRGLRVPMPMNLFPLPAKWRIVFLPPIKLEKKWRARIDDRAAMATLARSLRATMQLQLNAELERRPYIYFRALL